MTDALLFMVGGFVALTLQVLYWQWGNKRRAMDEIRKMCSEPTIAEPYDGPAARRIKQRYCDDLRKIYDILRS